MKTIRPTAFPADPELVTAADLGTAIRAARTGAGLTLDQAASALGAAKQTLQDLERGRGTVSVGFAIRAARELGVTLFVARSVDKERVRRTIAVAG
jgi:transcriptional regulator with XRE-family HTH domain